MIRFDSFFSAADAARSESTLARLGVTGKDWVLTGGFAIEIHLARLGAPNLCRPLHDIDFLCSAFADIPEALAETFWLRHVHPDDGPGKTLVQAFDPNTGVRVDVFRAYGAVMERAVQADFPFGPVAMIAAADLTARAARLSWDICEGKPVPFKYVRDFLRLADCLPAAAVAAVWPDHRKATQPPSFADAAAQIRQSSTTHPERFVDLVYSRDVAETCPRCRDWGSLRRTDAQRILDLAGYC